MCLLLLCLAATSGACTIDSILYRESDGSMMFDLNEAECMVADDDIKEAFGSTKLDACSWNDVFFNRNNGCPAHFYRKIVPFQRKVKESSENPNGNDPDDADKTLTAEPMFLLHVCRLGGAYMKEHTEEDTCALGNDEVVTPEKERFKLTDDGVEVCRTARKLVIKQCTKTKNPRYQSGASAASPLSLKKLSNACRKSCTPLWPKATCWKEFQILQMLCIVEI
jgi:hypothetical protein